MEPPVTPCLVPHRSPRRPVAIVQDGVRNEVQLMARELDTPAVVRVFAPAREGLIEPTDLFVDRAKDRKCARPAVGKVRLVVRQQALLLYEPPRRATASPIVASQPSPTMSSASQNARARPHATRAPTLRAWAALLVPFAWT